MARAKTNESRAAKLAKGYAQKAWLVSPAGQRALAAICRRDDITETEAMERAFAAYASPRSELTAEELLALLKRRIR